jgi:hypothetical protein
MHAVPFRKGATFKDAMAELVDGRSADPEAVIRRVAELNPHVDLIKKKKIPPGTVLILPDEPGVKRGGKGAKSPTKQAYDELGSSVALGFEAAGERVGKAAEAAAAERADLVAAMKSAIAKRQMESDPALHEQLGQALAASERRQKELKEAVVNLDLLRESFFDEFETMEELFR